VLFVIKESPIDSYTLLTRVKQRLDNHIKGFMVKVWAPPYP